MAAATKAKSKVAQPKSEQPASEQTKTVESQGVSTDGVEAQADSAESQAPEQPAPAKKVGPPEGLYPEDTELFEYKFKCNGDTVWLPLKFEQPAAVEVWEIHDKPMHIQTWAYMKWAKVPKVVQRKIVAILDLDVNEYMDCLDKWLTAAGGVRLGE